MPLAACAEITGAIVRVRESGESSTSPFCCAVAVVGDEGVAIIKALTEPPGGLTTADRLAVFAELRRLGFTRYRWRRHKGERSYVIEGRL
jgi:hypothetical protein